MTPRPYQSQAIEAVQKGFGEARRLLAVLPTGAGKTCIFSWLANLRQPRRTLILAHREELIDQAITKLRTATGIEAEKEKAEHRASFSAPVVVASVQSMIRRLDVWPASHFSLVVADEAHHAISDGWQKVLQHFDADVLGVTASPDRADCRNLGSYFDLVAFEIGLFDLIRDGYLSPIAIKSVPIKIDLNAVRQTTGDFNESDLGATLDPYLDEIAAAIKEHASFRRCLAFLPLIATSEKFVGACQNVGLTACHISGVSENRKEILQRYHEGEFDVLSNAMLLTEGYDEPQVDCVIPLRPTRSRPLYSQMVGRGTRTHELKENLLLLDFLWMHQKLPLCRPAHLIAKNDEQADAITELTEATPGGGEADLRELNTEAQEKREAALRKKLEDNSKKKLQLVDAMEFCVMAAQPDLIDYEPVMPWEAAPLTPGQLNVLRRNGIDEASVKGRGHASKLIDLINQRSQRNLCTPKQARLLARLGVKNPARLTLDIAGKLLDQRIGRRKEMA